MASFYYNKALEALFSGQLDFTASSGQTFKVALLDATYGGGEAERDGDNFFSDVSAFEISGTGYTAGGEALTGVDVTRSDANNRATVDADDVVWTTSTMTFRYGVLYRDTGTPTTSPVIKMIDFGSAQSTSGTDYVITWSAEGIMRISQAA